MVASLIGTPYMPKVRCSILFLKDVAEHPYRVEHMLAQLWQAGILQRQKAITKDTPTTFPACGVA